MNKIGIIGFGFVGQAIYSSIKDTEGVVIYDKFKKGYHQFKALLSCDYLFICVPTPTDSKGQNTEALDYVMSKLDAELFKGICIVKSTALPLEIEKCTKHLRMVANPEFLNQNFANEDFENQTFVILGGDAVNCCKVKDMYKKVFGLNTNYHITSIREAMEFKYIHNIYHAYNVLFWNYVQENFGNSRKHVALYENIYGRKPILSQIAPDGKLGYGGACFPKDVKAMDSSKPHELTEFMNKFNTRLRK